MARQLHQRLAKLTKATENNNKETLKEIYPDHFKALEPAKLVTRNTPTLEEEILKRKAEQAKPELTAKQAKEKQRDGEKKTFFCIGHSKIWNKMPVHETVKLTRDKHDLKWLRISMSCHRFTNLRETLQGDLSGKIMHGM